MRTVCPFWNSMGASQAVVRTSGPLVSMRIPMLGLTARTFSMTRRIPSVAWWAVLRRTTFIPAS